MLRHGRSFALAIADLDQFKLLNDTYGHAAGDRALRLFAQVVHSVVREQDLVARWGGEEFVIVLPDVDRLAAEQVLERLRTTLAGAHTGDQPRFTASFGLTDSRVADSFEQLLAIADNGLYRSKQAGRDCVTVGQVSTAAAERTVIGDETAETNGKLRKSVRPSLYEAVDEEEPQPAGREIR